MQVCSTDVVLHCGVAGTWAGCWRRRMILVSSSRPSSRNSSHASETLTDFGSRMMTTSKFVCVLYIHIPIHSSFHSSMHLFIHSVFYYVPSISLLPQLLISFTHNPFIIMLNCFVFFIWSKIKMFPLVELNVLGAIPVTEGSV